MNFEEVGQVLAKAASYDRRTTGAADILAWHEAIGDLPLQDALKAVTVHYQGTDKWLMPVHLRIICDELANVEARAALAAYHEEVANAEVCEHGFLGGHIPAPNGWTRCPTYRKEIGWQRPSRPSDAFWNN